MSAHGHAHLVEAILKIVWIVVFAVPFALLLRHGLRSLRPRVQAAIRRAR